MNKLFEIFFFGSSQALVADLILRLNRTASIAISRSIDDDKMISQRRDSTIPFAVLLVSSEDLANPLVLSALVNPDLFQERETCESLIVLGLGVKEESMPSIGVEARVLFSQNDAESVRRVLINFYRKRIRGEHSNFSFVGRNQELDQFQNLFYSESYDKTKAVIVSGHPGVGRDAFVWECIRRESKSDDYEPCTISIGDNGSIELLLIQINAFLHQMDDNDLRAVLSGDQDVKVNAAVELLNSLFQKGDYLVIYDDSRACVRYNRKLADWFKAIVSCPELNGQMRLFVISTVSVNYLKARVEDSVAFFTLYDLSLQDRKKLIYSYLSGKKSVLSATDVQFLLDSSVFSPSLLLRMIDDLCEKGIRYVKGKLGEYQALGDRKLRALIQPYHADAEPDNWNLLILLSKIEYISVGIIQAIFPQYQNRIDDYLNQFVADGIVERSGELSEYLRLDGSIGDYLRRNRQTYTDSSFNGHVSEVMSSMIVSNSKITADYSSFLYRIKEDILSQRTNQDTYLIPSIVLSTIIGAYEKRDWGKTIWLCEQTLSKKLLYFEEMIREIRYWYCLALARDKRDDAFYAEITYFNGDADYHFLKGFYLRIQTQYARAEEELRVALRMNPAFYRAKRELVITLQHQHKFSEALNMAWENYERDSDNPYHLLAYFRCLVRKPNLTYDERKDLQRMINEARDIFVNSYFIEGMEFEYARFVEKQKPDSLLPRTARLSELSKVNKAPYIQDIVGEYRVAQGLDYKIPITKQDEEIDE